MAEDPEEQSMVSAPAGVQPTKRSIARRSVVLWIVGVVSAEVLASGITWQKFLQLLPTRPIPNILGTATEATATWQAATATATFTAVVNPYDIGPWHLVYDESLTTNTSSQWDELRGSCAFTSRGYHVISQAAAPQVCVARQTNFNDMTLEVQMKLLSGNSGGILLGFTNLVSYYFRISSDGQYALFACARAGTSCDKILVAGFSSAITQGQNQTNLVAVVVRGHLIGLYVNSLRINQVDYSGGSLHGQIGFVAEVGSEVVFSNAKVWTL